MIEGFLISHFFASVYVHVQERHCEKIQTLVVRVLGGPFTTEYMCGGHFAGTLAIQTIYLVHRTIIVIVRKRKVRVSNFTSQTEFQS